MATVKQLLVCATLLLCVAASVGKKTATPSPSSTVPPATSKAPSPSPTVTPKPTPPASSQYFFPPNQTANTTCRIRLNGTMTWNITYTMTNKTTKSITETVENAVVNDKESFCHFRNSAQLTLNWMRSDNESRRLIFSFKAGNTRGKRHWELKNVTLNFTISDSLFPNYQTNHSRNGTFFSPHVIDDNNNEVEYQRSYRCASSRILPFKNATNASLTVTLNITNFQVQAFDFKEPNSTINAFGNARNCAMDTTGKKIVPIAVGVALGVLIIAVIIAFVISKVVNRKKSGYEALS